MGGEQIAGNIMDSPNSRRASLVPAEPLPAGARRNPLRWVVRRWRIVAAVAAITLLGFCVRALTATPVWRGQAVIYIHPGNVPAGAATNGSGIDLAAEAERIRSTATLGQALQVEGPGELPTFADTRGRLDALKRNLSVTVNQGDRTLVIAFDSQVRADAAAIPNAVVHAYQVVAAAPPPSPTPAAPQRIEPTGHKGEPDQVTDPALTEAQLATLKARTDYDLVRARVMKDPAVAEALGRLRKQSAVSIALADVETQLLAEVSQLQQKLNELSVRYLPNHPLVQTTTAEINQRTAAYLLAVEQRYERARQYEQEVRSALASPRAAASTEVPGDPASGIEPAAGVGEASPLHVMVIDEAREKDAVLTTSKSRTVFEGLMLGLILGVGATFLDRRFRSADEIRNALGLPIVGAIPHTHGEQSASVRGKKVQVDPASEVAEAYRTVRTALYFGTPDADARTILVTSPRPGDGKSTLASNLAIALAQAGQRTLILDADFRRPMQHRIFQTADNAGLSSVLSGRRGLAQAIQTTGIRNLEILPAGPIPPNPADVLNSSAFEELLKELAGKYDHIVLDCPPVMPAADARILGAQCDQTLLVVHAVRSNRKLAIHARDALVAAGANILGTVVNDIPRRQLGAQFGAYGARQHGHGEPVAGKPAAKLGTRESARPLAARTKATDAGDK